MQAQAERTAFPASGGSVTLQIDTNPECPWSVKSEQGWLTVSNQVQGQGAGAVTLVVAPNNDPSSRNGGIKVNDQAIQISQQGKPCEYRLSSTHEVLDLAGGVRTVDVMPSSGQCEWTAAASEAWIEVIEGRQGRGNGSLTFRVSALSGASRTGTLTIAGASVTVEQTRPPATPCDFVVEPGTYIALVSGGTSAIVVSGNSGCSWSATTATNWIAIKDGTSRNGPGRVEFSIGANTGPARTGSLVVAGRTIIVSQPSGCRYDVTPLNSEVPGAGGTTTVSIATADGCSWSASSGVPWITLSTPSGVGSAQIQLAASQNMSPAREARISIAGQTLTVTQVSACTYSLIPFSSSYDANGGQGAVLVIVSGACTWAAVSNSDWIRMRPDSSSGTGNGVMQFTVSPNSASGRSGVIGVAGLRHTVTQGAYGIR